MSTVNNFRKTKILASIIAMAIGSTGCSTMVTYKGKPDKAVQTARFTQGVGAITEKRPTHEVYMYPTFKTQGPSMPTFTIGYANNSEESVNFSPENIKATFRGQPIEIYTYTQRVAEIETDKRTKQVMLAIVGGLAAGAAAHAASRQTYQSNYSGAIATRRGLTTFGGSNTLRVYDPFAGIVAGSAVAGATGMGVTQIEFNAENEARVANSLLQENTVDPRRMVGGQLTLRNCCEQEPSPNDTIRFEVTVHGVTSVFEFQRERIVVK